MRFFKNLFKMPNVDELKGKIQEGSLLLDVRSPEEFKSGHAAGSVNIPLPILPSKVENLHKEISIVVVCMSGARSAQAVHFLKSKGFEAYNGGSWQSFRN